MSPGAHLQVVGAHPFPIQLDVQHVDRQVHPDGGPVLLDQLLERRLNGRGEERPRQPLAVRAQAEFAVPVPLQAQLVQHLVGPVRIVLRPRVVVVGVVVLGGGEGVDLGRLGTAEVQHLVDLVAVDRQRQRAAEVHLAEQVTQHLIPFQGLVDHQRGGALVGVLPQEHPVLAARLVLLEHRELLEVDGVSLGGGEVHLPADDLAVVHLQVLQPPAHDPVDVGELVACAVDLPVERVPLVDQQVGLLPGLGVRIERGQIRLHREADEVMVAVVEVLVPGIEPGLLGHLVGIAVVGDVELFQVVARRRQHASPPAHQ